jgi:two-component system response regulator TtrR
LPVIFLSGHGTVPTAVQALQDGALDFIEKPVDRDVLMKRIRSALQGVAEARSRAAKRDQVQQRIQQLTGREREIMDLIVNGKPSKVIAADLGISERTVELHRSRILQKMKVRNAVQLTQVVNELPD